MTVSDGESVSESVTHTVSLELTRQTHVLLFVI